MCFWEDDPVQNEDPQYRGKANSLSLEEARNNYVEMGASQREFLNNLRPPTPEEMPILRLLVGLDKARKAAVHRQAKIHILATLRDMLSGGINIVDGCDRIATLALQVDSHWDDKLQLFADVASECDEFPRGPARQEWEPHALARMDLELARRADRIRDRVLSACREFEALLKAELRDSASFRS